MKLNKFLRCSYGHLEYFFNHSRFKLLLLFMILLAVYASFALTDTPTGRMMYIPALLFIFNNRTFIMLLFFLLFMSTIHTYLIFNENFSSILRYENRKNYLLHLVKNTVLNNSCFLILQIIMVLIGLNLFCSYNFGITMLENLGITNLIYVIFVILKSSILLIIISLIIVFSLSLIPKEIVILINGLWGVCFVNGFSIHLFDKVNFYLPISLKIENYLTQISYGSFFEELFYSVLYITLLIVIVSTLFTITKNLMKQVGL